MLCTLRFIMWFSSAVLSSSSPTLTGGTGTVAVSLDSLPLFTGPFNTCGASQISLPLGFGTVYGALGRHIFYSVERRQIHAAAVLPGFAVNSAVCPVNPGGTFLLNFSVALPTNSACLVPLLEVLSTLAVVLQLLRSPVGQLRSRRFCK